MQKLKSMDIAKQAMDIIKKGAFLTVKAGKDMNTMAIGWGYHRLYMEKRCTHGSRS